MSELDDLKKEAVERIYLIPDREEGRLRYVWCDCPAPEYGMRDEDAVEYVRRDKYDALAAHVEALNELAAMMDDASHGDVLGNLLQALSDGPTISLACLRAKMKAEGVAEMIDLIPCDRGEARRLRDEYLDQAKGGEWWQNMS